ncbi:MAG TPA: arsenate reductase family protein [Mollicutes bacterium]|nr:arsenate reductase family protein [Mollicutes bacterium]
MQYLFLGYPRCSTSNKAEKFLKDNKIDYNFRNITVDKPTVTELTLWIKKSELPIKRFFNTSGLVYKELNLKDKLATMTEEEQIELLSTNGMLVKRPLLVNDDVILVGFKEEDWKQLVKE